MADLKSSIQSRYGIDIDEENILKLYHIEDKPDLSDQERDRILADVRAKWQTSVDSNGRFADRDQKRLDKADRYETILKDEELRRELYAWYAGTGRGGGDSSKAVEMARDYFRLIATTKKLRKEDVDFFLDYYREDPEIGKNEKAIRDMVQKEFKVSMNSGKGRRKENGEQEEAAPEKKKGREETIVRNAFERKTILDIRKCLNHYETARSSSEICGKIPDLAACRDLYGFLKLNRMHAVDQLASQVDQHKAEAFRLRQEWGTAFVPLVDLYNSLGNVLARKDVKDNFEEFKLLIRYPDLTPYMFAFVEVKPKTLDGLLEVAKESQYDLGSETELILNYYCPLYDNFNISNASVNGVIRKAQKHAASNTAWTALKGKLNRGGARTLSIPANILLILVYWPVYLVYLVFETVKAILTLLPRLYILVFAGLFLLMNTAFSSWSDTENLLVLTKIFSKSEWYAFLESYMGFSVGTWYAGLLLSIEGIFILLVTYIVPPLFGAIAFRDASVELNKNFDWKGYERTFGNIISGMRQRAAEKCKAAKAAFYKKFLLKALTNLICIAALVLAAVYVPAALEPYAEAAGAEEMDLSEELPQEEADEDAMAQAQSSWELVVEGEVTKTSMVITVRSANIRSGPGSGYSIIGNGKQDEVFIATGNEESADDGIWYEIYLDEEQTQTGWASESVIAVQE